MYILDGTLEGGLDKRFGLGDRLGEILGPREVGFSVGYSQAAVQVVKGKIFF